MHPMQSAAQLGWILVMVLVLVSVFIVVAASRHQGRLRKKREAALGEVARRVGGRVKPGSFWKQPQLAIEHRGTAGRLEFYSTGGKNPTLFTRLHFQFPAGPPFRVRVYPERFFSQVGKWFGAQDILIGDEAFDDKFMIKGDNPERVCGFLSPEVREAVFELRAMIMNDHVEVRTRKDALLIQKLKWLDAPDLVESFVVLGKRVLDGYLRAAGLAGTGTPGQPPAATSERCVVCNRDITGSSRACPACGAPHHPACWELNDGCATCAEKEHT